MSGNGNGNKTVIMNVTVNGRGREAINISRGSGTQIETLGDLPIAFGSTKYLGLVLVVRLRVWMALVCGGFIFYVIFSPYSSCLTITIFFLSFSPCPLLSGFPVFIGPCAFFPLLCFCVCDLFCVFVVALSPGYFSYHVFSELNTLCYFQWIFACRQAPQHWFILVKLIITCLMTFSFLHVISSGVFESDWGSDHRMRIVQLAGDRASWVIFGL